VLTGSFWILYLYDVSEEIQLDALRAQPPGREPAFRHPAPEYVRFQKPPVIEPLEPIEIGGEKLRGQIAWYDYGVVSVQLERPFRFEWEDLVLFSSQWIAAPEIEARVGERVRQQLERVRGALVKPYEQLLTEDYYVVRVDPSPGTSAARLAEEHGSDIARIVRAEPGVLSEEERTEALRARMSYYPGDLLVAAWMAAFVYDTPEGAGPSIQLLEYANTQLLQFRHYDEVLTRRLAEVYQTLEKGTGWFRRWQLAREAGKLNAIRLDIRELTERADTAIKFLSDMFSARLYQLAAAKVGVPDYRRLVDEKLHTAGELYQSMNERFHQSSALVLELMVVIILIIELFYLFRGKA
jgi:hypothetical protein